MSMPQMSSRIFGMLVHVRSQPPVSDKFQGDVSAVGLATPAPYAAFLRDPESLVTLLISKRASGCLALLHTSEQN
jgi:hypothetical protein